MNQMINQESLAMLIVYTLMKVEVGVTMSTEEEEREGRVVIEEAGKAEEERIEAAAEAMKKNRYHILRFITRNL